MTYMSFFSKFDNTFDPFPFLKRTKTQVSLDYYSIQNWCLTVQIDFRPLVIVNSMNKRIKSKNNSTNMIEISDTR